MSNTKQITAINIQPITKAQEKIIVRGAQVSTKESSYDKMMKEYTRFVPPTTLAVTRIDGNIILAPVTTLMDDLPPVRQLGVPKRVNAVTDKVQLLPFLPSGTLRMFFPLSLCMYSSLRMIFHTN